VIDPCTPARSTYPMRPIAQRAPTLPAWLALLPIAAAMAMTPASVRAQAGGSTERTPFYYGAGLTLGSDSNVFRAPAATAQSDTYTILSLLAGFDQPISRQRAYGDLALRQSNYSSNSRLNGTGYGATIGLDWATVARLSGTLRYTASQTQAQFSSAGFATINDRNTETRQSFLALGRWGLADLFQVEAQYVGDRLAYGNSLARNQDLEQDTLGVSVRYSPSPALSFGVGGRTTDGKYPTFFLTAPGIGSPLEFDRRDIDFTIGWVPSGITRLDARISSTNVDYKQDSARDVNGVTGSLTFGFRPTGRTSLSAQIFRDTGPGATFLQLGAGGSTSSGDNSQISTGLRFAATYDVTAKIQASANLGLTQREYSGALGGGEDLTNFGLGARYAFSRAITFACNLAREQRDASTALSFSYTANTFLCNAQVLLR
jgi:hypothetical protein